MKKLTGTTGEWLVTDEGEFVRLPTELYWNIAPILETHMHVLYGCGGRGIGKTYGSREYCMDQFAVPFEEECKGDPKLVEKAIDAGVVRRFLYMRRRKAETIIEAGKFFSRHPAEVRENWKVGRNRTIFYKGMIAGYMMSLEEVRGAGIDFAGLGTILLDEFISHKTGAAAYLRDEYNIFMGAVDSACRYDDKVRVMAFSNAVSMYNPYFLNEGYLATGQKMWTNPERSVAIEWCETSKKLIQQREQSWFGKWTAGTEYGDFSLYNKSLRDNDNFIRKKGRYCVLRAIWSIDDRLYGIWYDKYSNDVFFSENVGNKDALIYDMTTIDKAQGTLSRRAFLKSYAGTNLVDRLDKGHVFFESQIAKQAFFSVMKGNF